MALILLLLSYLSYLQTLWLHVHQAHKAELLLDAYGKVAKLAKIRSLQVNNTAFLNILYLENYVFFD